MYFKVLVESGTARPTTLVFSFLLDEEAVLPLSFLFFSEFALACSRRKLTGDALVSASSCGSISESMIGGWVLEVATFDSGVADDGFTCVGKGCHPSAPRRDDELDFDASRVPHCTCRGSGGRVEGCCGYLHGRLFVLATGSVEDKNKQQSSLDLSEVGKSEGSKPEEGSTPQPDHCERCIRG